jgi:hypothetical protein
VSYRGFVDSSQKFSAAALGSAAVVAIVALFALAFGAAAWHDAEGEVRSTMETVLVSDAGSFVRVLVGMALALLVWALVRPRDGARFAVGIPGAIVLATLVIAVWGPGFDRAPVTLGEKVNAAWKGLHHVESATKAGLYVASLAASVAGLAYALRARAASRSPRVTGRAARATTTRRRGTPSAPLPARSRRCSSASSPSG